MNWKENLLRGYFGILSLGVMILMFLVIFQVFARYLFAISPLWIEEAVAYLLVFTGLLGAAYAFYQKKHIALTFLHDMVPPSIKIILDIIVDSIVLLFSFLILIVGGIIFTNQTAMLKSPGARYPLLALHILLPIAGVIIVVLLGISIVEKIQQIQDKNTEV